MNLAILIELREHSDTSAMEHSGISTQYQKHVAKFLFAKIEAGDCIQGEKRKFAKTVVAEYVKSALEGEHQKMYLHDKDIRRNLQNVYELLIVYTEIKNKSINLTEDDFEQLNSSKLALLSPFISMPEYRDKLELAVMLVKTGTAREIRALKKRLY